MLRAVALSTCLTARRIIVVSLKPNVLRSKPSRDAWHPEHDASKASRPKAGSGGGVTGSIGPRESEQPIASSRAREKESRVGWNMAVPSMNNRSRMPSFRRLRQRDSRAPVSAVLLQRCALHLTKFDVDEQLFVKTGNHERHQPVLRSRSWW